MRVFQENDSSVSNANKSMEQHQDTSDSNMSQSNKLVNNLSETISGNGISKTREQDIDNIDPKINFMNENHKLKKVSS